MLEIENKEIYWAKRLVIETDVSVFLTGNAGTGKSTFLRWVAENCRKNMVVLAPTGVAAINAKGTTIHSFFNLPFAPFNPTQQFSYNDDEMSSGKLLSRLRYNNDKKAILQELELIIIDEISMVRADVLDAVDFILRHYRNVPNVPFGGVQLLLVGDLYQLPPIAEGNTWDILSRFYTSPFFYAAHAMQKLEIVKVHLRKIYRQNDENFIQILNSVRNNQVTPEIYQKLNQNLGKTIENALAITLCTHRNSANAINDRNLTAIQNPKFTYNAEIEGDFRESSYPVEPLLVLKEGAQIMFIKNDMNNPRRYFNGKLGKVTKLEKEKIWVEIQTEDGLPYLVDVLRDTWTQYEYQYDASKNSVVEKEIGNFKHYPIRLAWAITVHKSQGLTFDHVYLDLKDSFASGQSYVALSRCRSLEGISLKTEFPTRTVPYPHHLIEYMENYDSIEDIENIVRIEGHNFLSKELMRIFNFTFLQTSIDDLEEIVYAMEHKLKDFEKLFLILEKVKKNIEHLVATNHSFRKQLNDILGQAQSEARNQLLKERTEKAIVYFGEYHFNNILIPLYEFQAEIALYSGISKERKKIAKIVNRIEALLSKLEHTHSLGLDIQTTAKHLLKNKNELLAEKNIKPSNIVTVKKVLSHIQTYNLIKEGKLAEEVAAIRNLTLGTVLNHTLKILNEKEIMLTELFPPNEVNMLIDVLQNAPSEADYQYFSTYFPNIQYDKIKVARKILRN